MRCTPGVKTFFQMLAIARHAETEDPVDQRGENIPFRRHTQPGGINGCLLNATEKIEQPDNDHQAGIFEECDDGIYQPRNYQLQRLWQNNQPLSEEQAAFCQQLIESIWKGEDDA